VERAVDGQVRERLDGRYAYNFTLRWVPFAGVPFEGSIACGRPAAPGAASASTLVTMPYRTGIAPGRIEEAISPELSDIENATREYRAGGSAEAYRLRLGAGLNGSMEKSGRLMVEEVLRNTLYAVVPRATWGTPWPCSPRSRTTTPSPPARYA